MDEHAQTVGNFLDGRHAKAAARIAELEAELAAERQRREAAEAALRQVSLSAAWNSGAQDKVRAHFACYKD